MKNYILIAFLLLGNFIKAQDSSKHFSTINIILNDDKISSACRPFIKFPNQEEFNAGIGSIVQYKIYSEGEITIDISLFCQALNETKQALLNVVVDNDYYIVLDYNKKEGIYFKEFKKSEVLKFLNKFTNKIKKEENLENPIK